MRLDIKHWQLLEAVSRFGSLGHAAEALGVTQSALSHRLAEAERRLGSAIFQREGRALRITPAGQILLEAAQAVLPELARAEQDFARTATDANHLVRIGVAAYSTYHWVPGFLKTFPVSRAKVQLDFIAAATRNAEHTLLSGTTDILLSPYLIANPGVVCQPLMQDELVLVVPPNHPLAQQAFVTAEALADENYLTYCLDKLPGFEYERVFRPAGVRLRHVQLVEMTDTIVEMIAAELGVSILSRWALERPLQQGLVKAIPVTAQGLTLQWYLVSRKDSQQSSAVQLTLDVLQDWFTKEGTG